MEGRDVGSDEVEKREMPKSGIGGTRGSHDDFVVQAYVYFCSVAGNWSTRIAKLPHK